jgi:hypothetical protein
MGVSIVDRLRTAWVILVVTLCTVAPFAGVYVAAQEGQGEIAGLVNVKECEGVTVTQCEVAKNLMNTLQMGEDLTCGACFNHLHALGIAPGQDWSYEDPHKEITQKEMKELIMEVNLAYMNGNVRFDGLEAAAGINDFCREMKGPAPPQGVETEAEAPTTANQEPGMEEETSE